MFLLENSFSLLLKIVLVNVLFHNLKDNAFRQSDFLQNRSDNILVLISRMIASVGIYFFKSGATEHSRVQCRFRNVVCSRCKRTGHISRVCKRGNMQNNFVEQKLSSDDVFLEEELFTGFDVNSLYKSEISVPLKIENQECSLQLDAGCALSLAPQTFYEQFCSHIPLKPTAVRLSTYTGEKIQPLRQINVNVTYAGTQHSLPLLVVPQGSGVLFGRKWLRCIKLDWNNLPGIESPSFTTTATCSKISENKNTLDSLLSKYDELNLNLGVTLVML